MHEYLPYFPAYNPQALFLALSKKYRQIIRTGALSADKNVRSVCTGCIFIIHTSRVYLKEKKLFNLILRISKCGFKELGISKRS